VTKAYSHTLRLCDCTFNFFLFCPSRNELLNSVYEKGFHRDIDNNNNNNNMAPRKNAVKPPMKRNNAPSAAVAMVTTVASKTTAPPSEAEQAAAPSTAAATTTAKTTTAPIADPPVPPPASEIHPAIGAKSLKTKYVPVASAKATGVAKATASNEQSTTEDSTSEESEVIYFVYLICFLNAFT